MHIDQFLGMVMLCVLLFSSIVLSFMVNWLLLFIAIPLTLIVWTIGAVMYSVNNRLAKDVWVYLFTGR